MEIPGYIALTYPQGLLLGALLVFLFVRFVRRRNVWRGLLLALAVLLLAYPALKRGSRSFDLFVVADRSRSISEEGRAKQLEVLELISGQLRAGDRLGVISFNERAHIEQIAEAAAPLKSFAIPSSEDASDLTEGLDLALSQVRPNRPARVLVLSDGEYTGQDPTRAAQQARQMNVPIAYRDLKRAETFNLAVRDVETPDQLLANEPYRVVFRVHATQATPGRYRLLRDGRVIGAEQDQGWQAFEFQQGENLIPFVDSLAAAGIHAYRLEVESIPLEREKLLTDNAAERYVKIIGERPLLLVNETGAPDNVASILAAGGVQAHIVPIGSFRMSIAQLAGYKGVILNNVPVLGQTLSQLADLRDFVLEEGGGLVVMGGNRSFAAGGYYKSELDAILPVSLEDRQQNKKVSTAFSIVLDRSGSMAASTPGGQTKMALANAAVVESLALLSAADSLSVIAVDSAPHVFVEQQPVQDPAALASQVRRIESMGGGIFTYTGLVAAGQQLMRAPHANKHILLFADAADAEEPGEYIRLLADYTAAGITVSVVGLGTEQDGDAEFLRDIARRGNGNVYFTQDAAQLVQFFTADTISYTRNSFVEDSVPMSIRAAAYTISPQQQWSDFAVGGYNLLFQRPRADAAIITADEDAAPTLATWQQGLGRVAALAFDAEGAFAGAAQYGDIVLSTVRWAMGSNVEDSLAIGVIYQGNYGRIRMEVSDEERQRLGGATLRIFAPDGTEQTRPLNWSSPNRMEADLKLTQQGLYRGVIEMGEQAFRIPPMSIPVSPEFAPDREEGYGRRVLERIATISGGSEVIDVGTLFERDAISTAVAPFVTPLLVAFVVLLLLEIAEPRFGLIARLRGWARSARGMLARGAQARPAMAGGGAAGNASAESGGVDSALAGRRGSGRAWRSSPGSPAAKAEPPVKPAADAEPKAKGEVQSASPPPAGDMDYLKKAKLQSTLKPPSLPGGSPGRNPPDGDGQR